MKEVKINTEIIRLDAFLKWAGVVGMGSEAKILVQNGEVMLNGETETHRTKKIKRGDIIEFNNEKYKVI